MTQWIAAITRGHNAGICLLKDGEIVFSIEEERLSRHKYDGGPYASMIKILDYTDRLDYLAIAHTQPLKDTAGHVDFTGDDVYTGLARKLGLIDRKANLYDHPQVIDLSQLSRLMTFSFKMVMKIKLEGKFMAFVAIINLIY